MRKLFVLIIMFLILSCGKDGKDGNAYLSFEWDVYVDSYWDNNPDIPDPFYASLDYLVQPGTYEYEYYCSDGTGEEWYWDGTYTIVIDKGEKGGFFSTGPDGSDNYFRLDMIGLTGPEFYYMKIKANFEVKESLTTPTIDLSLYNKIPIGFPETTVQYSNNGSMTITGQWFKLEIK